MSEQTVQKTSTNHIIAEIENNRKIGEIRVLTFYREKVRENEEIFEMFFAMTISQISTDLNECYAGCMFIQGVLIKRVENKTRAIGSAAPVV